MRRGAEPRDPFYGESYDEWRIICRGPIDASTLLTYSNSDKCVIWGSPYTGNLWTDPGTIEDSKTQDMLMKFLDYGGRLLVTGQDVAWALTKDGKEYNKFLTEYMKVRYIADQAGKWTLTATPNNIADLPGQGDVPGTGGIFAIRDKSKAEAKSQQPAEGGTGGGTMPIKLAGYYYGIKKMGPDPEYWAGDACKNQWWEDVVMPEAPAEAILTYSGDSTSAEGGAAGNVDNAGNAAELPNPGVDAGDGQNAGPAMPKLVSNAAGVCYWDTRKGYKTIFLAFGFESIRPGFETYQDPEAKQAAAGGGGGDMAATEYATMNNRARLMASFITWLRTGKVTGVVTDGVKPLNNAVIEVYLGSNDTKPIYKTTTLSDGSYTIMGIDSGSYTYIKARYPGFYDHVIGCIITGGRTTTVDFKLSTVTKGLVYGRVMMPNEVTPISRALIEVIWTNPVTKEESVIKVAYTEFDGRYLIGDLKGAQYKVRASAQGMVPKVIDKVTVKDEGSTMVNFKLDSR